MAKKRSKKPAQKSRLITGDQALAKHFGVTAKTVYNWRQAGLPFTTSSNGAYVYDLDQAEKFREELRRESDEEGEGAEGGLNAKLKRERLRQLEIRTRGMLAQLQQTEGELLPRRTWELFATTVLTALGDWCEQLPELIAGECCPKCKRRIEERLGRELNDRRNDVAEELTHGPSSA